MRFSASCLAAIAALSAAMVSPALAEDVTVSMVKREFAPAEVTVAKGTTVVFRNDDPGAHQVIGKEGEVFDLKLQKGGEETKYTFTKAGTFPVLCDLHPKMILKVTVQ